MAGVALAFSASGASVSAREDGPFPLFTSADLAPSDSAEFQPDATWPLMLGPSIVNPAEEVHQPASPQSQPSENGLTHAWELPPVSVVGEAIPDLREEQRVGSYKQPVWTTDRRFAETRVYVRPEGSLQFEYWFIPEVARKGPSQFTSQFELEFGLPHRFQLDLYLSPTWLGDGGPTYMNEAIELRYAFADWNVIWGNPTAYIEFTKQDQGPDQLEAKLLLGGEIAPRWHWGADLTYQHDMGYDNENTYETTSGVSYTLRDNIFDIGAEFKLQENEFRGARGHYIDNVLLGPSLQYRPMPRVHVDVVPLIGLTHESSALQMYLVVGWEF